MKEYDTEQLLELFDGKEIGPPDTPEDIPEEGVYLPPFEQSAEPNFVPKNKHRRMRRPRKKNGVMALPVYKATFDTYKECRFRFRKCTKDTKEICREVTGNLKRIMVNIELFHWQVKPKSILADTLELVVETIVIIRSMKDFGEINTKDFSIICQYSSQMLYNMMKWNKHYNASVRRAEQKEEIL